MKQNLTGPLNGHYFKARTSNKKKIPRRIYYNRKKEANKKQVNVNKYEGRMKSSRSDQENTVLASKWVFSFLRGSLPTLPT